jgi:hypothetical protein
MTTTSTPTLTNSANLSRSSGLVPTDAPTNNCCVLSFDAFGYSRFFNKSLREIKPHK